MVEQRVQPPAPGHSSPETMTNQDYNTLRESGTTFRHCPEHDKFEAETKNLAKSGFCDGCCDEHIGRTEAVRVAGPDGCDWGWFSYCEAAKQVNVQNGFFLYIKNPAGTN